MAEPLSRERVSKTLDALRAAEREGWPATAHAHAEALLLLVDELRTPGPQRVERECGCVFELVVYQQDPLTVLLPPAPLAEVECSHVCDRHANVVTFPTLHAYLTDTPAEPGP